MLCVSGAERSQKTMTSMQKVDLLLYTLDAPPETGGVARYLGDLLQASHGAMELVDVRVFFRPLWPRWWPLVRKIYTERRKKILISHVLPVGTAAWISKMMGGPEYAILFHGLDLRRIHGPWKRWLLCSICHSASALFCNSASTMMDLRRLVPDAEGVILTPGIYPPEIITREKARQHLGIALDAKVVLSIARCIPRKGIDIALRAMGRIQHMKERKDLRSEVKYVVIGDGPDSARLRQVAGKSQTQVQWIHNADDAEKWQWLAASDVFLLPVRDEGDDVEGFGIVFLEAAIVGVPSVAGKSGGAVEAVIDGHTGLVVKADDVDAVENAIGKLLHDADLRQRLGTAAKTRAVCDFRWEDRWATLVRILGVSDVQRGSSGVSSTAISVVIPCYNHASELRTTLAALSAQTYLASEIIVVDDGSIDNPENIVKEFEDRLPVRYFRLKQRYGAPFARNKGAELTDAPYLIFLDADAEMVPNAFEIFASALDMHPECDIAYSNFLWGQKLFRGQAFSFVALKRRNYITTSSLIRRAAFPRFDEALKKFQDWDLWLTMAQSGSSGYWIDHTLFQITPRREGISRWLPKITHRIPWRTLGYEPREIGKYREAEEIIRKKHHI